MKKAFKILVPILLALLILGSIVWYLFVYDRTFTRDTLIRQARFQDAYGNTRISSLLYNAAYHFSDYDESVAIELANQYEADGNFTKAEYTLTNAIRTGPTLELYIALSRTFVRQDKLLDAVSLLDSVTDPDILAQLRDLRPSAPSADYAGGYYSQHMDIHLRSSASTIYYTLDGTYPSVAGDSYAGAVTLPTGESTVYAIAVSDIGLVSPVTVLGYTITGIIEEVTFTDPAMEAAIREQLGVSSQRVLMTDALWQITEFTVPEKALNYSDLALLTHLQKLTITGKFLDSLEALLPLTQLKTLDLTGSRFPSEALATLAQLPALKELTLADCALSTISDLAGAQLTYLDVSNNTIRNLEVLSLMTELQELDLDHNAVTSLSALGPLGKLKTLKVSYNALTSLESIGGCQGLTHIEADYNQINTLRGVHLLSALQHLSVDYNQLTTIDRLSDATELVNLSIASNAITNLVPISGLTKLEVLDFSSNHVQSLPKWPDNAALQTVDGSFNQLDSIDSLANQENLSHVYMDYNLITNIDALENCYRLVQVNVYGNPIPDVQKLRDHDIIVNYDPTMTSSQETSPEEE